MDIKVWLIQEWRALNHAFDERGDKFDVPSPWRAFAGRATAVIVTGTSWTVMKTMHSQHSSLVIVCLPCGT